MGSKNNNRHAQVTPKLEHTTDLDQFIFISTNRNLLSDDKIQDLAESIEKRGFLHSIPIVINSQFEIQDGQNRLSAAKHVRDVNKTTVKVWYTIDDNWTPEDTGELNALHNDWKNTDWVKLHGEVHHNQDYTTLRNFCDKYQVSIAIGRELLNGGHAKKQFRDGDFKVRFESHANQVMRHIQQLKPHLHKSVPINTKFVKAISILCKNSDYDPKQMIQRLSKSTYDTKMCGNHKQYVEMLQEIYNHYQSKKVNFLRAFDKY